MSPRHFSYLNLALCIALWASIPLATKTILVEMTHYQMLFWSTLFSTLTLAVLLLLRGKLRALTACSGRDYVWMAVLGFLGAYLYYILLYASIDLTVGAEGFILAYTWPILVSLLAVLLLGERLTPARAGGVLVSFVGVAIIVTKGSLQEIVFTSLVGDLLALAGAFVFALFSVLGKGRRFDPTVAATLYFVAALVCVTVTLPLTGTGEPSGATWLWLLYNGVLVNGVTYVFWFNALRHGDTFVISNALYLTPALSLVYVYLFLSEPILPSHIAGLFVILAGIALQSRLRAVQS